MTNKATALHTSFNGTCLCVIYRKPLKAFIKDVCTMTADIQCTGCFSSADHSRM